MPEMSISENKKCCKFQHTPDEPSGIASLGSTPDGIGGVTFSPAVILRAYVPTSKEGFQAILISGVVGQVSPGMGVHKKITALKNLLHATCIFDLGRRH